MLRLRPTARKMITLINAIQERPPVSAGGTSTSARPAASGRAVVSPPVEIRDAKYNDLPRIIEIERLSFTQPWSPNSFRRELSLSFSRTLLALNSRPGAKVIVGYLCRWLVAGEMHVLNIAVHPDHRQTGVATALLSAAVAEAERKQAQLVILEVRRSNLPARKLYRKFGFQERRLRRNYYGPGEDALVMELAISSLAARKRGSV